MADWTFGDAKSAQASRFNLPMATVDRISSSSEEILIDADYTNLVLGNQGSGARRGPGNGGKPGVLPPPEMFLAQYGKFATHGRETKFPPRRGPAATGGPAPREFSRHSREGGNPYIRRHSILCR